MSAETTTPASPDDLRAALDAQRAAGAPPTVSFKWETDTSGPAWIERPDGSSVPLAVLSWEDGEHGPTSCTAWFPFSYVRRWARQVGAQVEEW